jgi:hypothetical protein
MIDIYYISTMIILRDLINFCLLLVGWQPVPPFLSILLRPLNGIFGVFDRGRMLVVPKCVIFQYSVDFDGIDADNFRHGRSLT